ncbi:Alpha/Beta hydrolase protein [Aspergillus karnatakaensis]|uniref:alpha/beta hydrolase n=1 Tax=Aspergillus karnatakaensis TaxID=1810916 RepID=UPI003CCD4100
MDFSEYTGPSAEWIALEKDLPTPAPGLSVEQLRAVTNKGREDVAAKEMVEHAFDKKVILTDYSIPTRDGSAIEARSYRAVATGSSDKLPVYIHLHGGGFLFGSIASEDATCSRIVVTLAEQGVPVLVFNVNYRHTPEHKYPTAWDDTEDAFHWVHDHISELGGDPDTIIFGGISAGGWLSASTVLSQHLGTDKELAARPKIKGQVLLNPALLHYDCYGPQLAQISDPNRSSYAENRDAPVLPLERAKLFTSLLGIGSEHIVENNLRLNPANATADQVKGLPPATLGIAGRDIMRDEGLLFAKLLSENGVPTKTTVFKGLPHGFRRFGPKLSVNKKWDETIVEGIKWALGDAEAGPFVINAF